MPTHFSNGVGCGCVLEARGVSCSCEGGAGVGLAERGCVCLAKGWGWVVQKSSNYALMKTISSDSSPTHPQRLHVDVWGRWPIGVLLSIFLVSKPANVATASPGRRRASPTGCGPTDSPWKIIRTSSTEDGGGLGSTATSLSSPRHAAHSTPSLVRQPNSGCQSRRRLF